jgi:hypothetical protein
MVNYAPCAFVIFLLKHLFGIFQVEGLCGFVRNHGAKWIA